jgi:putative transcriptional regulator
MSEPETASFLERLKKGMEASIAFSRGELTLKTTTLPMPPPPAGRAKVIALRKKLKMSQSVFAAAPNVSTKLVQSWEQGSRKPDRGELRLIQILIKRPDLVRNLILGDGPVPSAPKAARNGRPASKKRAAGA